MPGAQPRRAPPPAMTGDLWPGPVAGSSRGSPQPHGQDGGPIGRTATAPRGAGRGAQAAGLEPQPQRVGGPEPKAALLSPQPLSGDPGEAGTPRAPLPRRGPAQARARRASRAGGSPQQLQGLSTASMRAGHTLDAAPEGPPPQAPLTPEGEAPGARLRPGPPRAEAPPAPEELGFPGRPQEVPPRFMPTGYGSAGASPAPTPLPGARRGSSSPRRPAPYPECPTAGASAWAPTAEDSFPGGGFRPPPSKPEPFPEGSGPGVVFEHPFPRGAAERECTPGPLVLAFHQPPAAWPGKAVGPSSSAACQLPPAPAPPAPPCYPGGLSAPRDMGRALPGPSAARPDPSPFAGGPAAFPDGLHQGLAEAQPVAHGGLGSPRGHFPGARGADPTLGALDIELAAPAPPMRRPQLWGPAAAPLPTPALGPAATPRGVFFEGQQLGLTHGPPLPWPQVLPSPAPSPHPVEMLGRPTPFAPGGLEWGGGMPVALGSGSPGPFPHSRPQDPGAQSLFFGVASPQGPSPARVVAASPGESPLPSPATGGSTCSSLSPPARSPANPSPEDGQLPGAPTFFHAPSHPQGTGSPFPPPEASQRLSVHCPPEAGPAGPFPTGGLGTNGTFKRPEGAPFPGVGPEAGQGVLEGFPQGLPPYAAHHFALSSASLDQLDVLLTCRQCDRNYSSLAAFLGHRQFCSLLLARARDRHPQPPAAPAPPAAPRAVAAGSPGLLGHAKAAPFLLGGDPREDGREDALRGSLGPGLAATFPLPAADLDPEDEAKLDSLITEALSGLGYQSDTPEIDSSFIDVFADEEPPGPGGPGAGQPPKTRAGTVPESKVQPPPPAAADAAEPQAPRPPDGVPAARSWPRTRPRGPASAEASRAGLVGRQRRGKRLTWLRREQGPAGTPDRPGRAPGAPHLRPRPVGSGAEPPLHARDLRSRAPKGRAARHPQALPAGPRNPQRPRGPRRRGARGGGWSRELIHRILRQKNQPSAWPAHAPPQQPPGSESEEDGGPQPRGPRCRGRAPQGCRRPRGEKRKEQDLAPGPRDERGQQKPRKIPRQEALKDEGAPSPADGGRPCLGAPHPPETPHPAKSPEAGAPRCADGTTAATPRTPEENEQSTSPGVAGDRLPGTPRLRGEALDSPARACGGRGPCPEPPAQPQPSRGSPRGQPRALDMPSCSSEEPAPLPAELLVPPAPASDAGPPGCGTLLPGGPGLGGDPAPADCGSVGPKEPAAPLRRGPTFEPEAPGPSSQRLCPDEGPASSRQLVLPQEAPHALGPAPGRARPPGTLEPSAAPPSCPVPPDPGWPPPLPGQRPSAAPTRPPPSPGPGGLCEDELEIKRLVAELERQLQGSRGAWDTPGQTVRLPAPLSPRPEGADAALAPAERQPPSRPGEAAPTPGAARRPGRPCAGRGCGECPGGRVPRPGEQREAPGGARRVGRCSPRRDPSPPGDSSTSALPPHPVPLQPAPGPRGDLPSPEPASSLAVPGLACWGAVPEGHAAGSAGRPEQGAEGSGEPVPAGASPGAGLPEPGPSADQRPRHPPASPHQQLQLLVSRTARRDDPSDPQGGGTEGGGRSPSRDLPGALQVTATPQHPALRAGGRLQALSQTEAPTGPGRASQLQSENWGRPGAPGSPATVAGGREAALGTPAGHADQLGGQSRGRQGQATPSAAPGAAPSQAGPGAQAANEVAGPGLRGPLAEGRAAPPSRTPASPAPAPCSGRALPLAPAGGPQGPPASPPRGDPTSPRPCPPAPFPTSDPPGPAGCSPPHADPVATLARSASPCGLEGSLPLQLPWDSRPPQGLPLQTPSPTPAGARHHPEGRAPGAPEGSGGERPRGPPPADTQTAAPPGRPPADIHLGHREVWGTAGPTMLGAAGLDQPPCSVGTAGASLEGQEDPQTQGPGDPVIAIALKPSGRGPPASCPSTELRPGGETVPLSPAGKARPCSPQDLRDSPHRTPQGAPKRKPALAENGRWKERAPSGQPPTCEVCAASFRSGPGLSRHRAWKHGLHRGATPLPHPAASPPHQPQNPPAKKSRRSPGKEKPGQAPSSPHQAVGPAPAQGCSALLDTPGPGAPLSVLGSPGCSPSQETQPPGPATRKADMQPAGPRRGGPLEQAVPQPRTADSGGQQRGRERAGWPGRSGGKSNKKATRKASARGRREQSRPRAAPDVISDRDGSNPSTVTANYPALARRLPPAAGPGSPPAEPPHGATPGAPETPARASRDWPAWAGLSRGQPGALGCQDPQQRQPAGGQGAREGRAGPGAPECEGAPPAAPGPGLGGPLSAPPGMASSSWLFPLGLEKNPRVHGKRGKRPRPAPPREAPGPRPPGLSSSCSPCLSLEEPPEDGTAGPPQPAPLDPLGSEMPGVQPWAACAGLWGLEPAPEAACGQPATPGAEDHLSDGIPELHMVPAAWRGLGPPTPAEDAAPARRDSSPEPPSLEPERCADGPTFTVLGRQALLPPAPREGPAGPPSLSFLGPESAANTGGPRPRGSAGPRRGPRGARLARSRRAPYKCRVCFQRFAGLGELDLHRLAHSPAPPPTCYMCVQRRFGSRELLREHLRGKHVQARAGPWACGMCLREEADVWMYNEHLRGHAARFARRPPARRALGGRPEGAAACLPGQAEAQGPAAPRDDPREQGTPQGSSPGGSAAPAGAPPPRRSPPPLSSRAAPAGPAQTPPSPAPGPEAPPPAAQVHADCKDPARDCHHCGKRFPKPFKLQRHLAVHSPQRVYLCPRCPQVYAEHGQLRAHLGRAHGASEERELPHTPLYACELCASVTRISRRSFVCSSCNYTFAKKEQFDRHMDKHRRRGQPPFPFRSVRRPAAPAQKAPAHRGALPSKQRRVPAPCSPPALSRDPPLSPEGSPAALPLPCAAGAAGSTEGQPRAPESPVGHPGGTSSLLSDMPVRLPLPPSPFPAALAGSKVGHKTDGAPGSAGREAPAGDPRPPVQRALPLEGSLPQPRASGQGAEGRRTAGHPSGRRGPPAAPDHGPEAPSQLWKEKQVSARHTAPEGNTGAPPNKSSPNKAGGRQGASKGTSTPLALSKAAVPETPEKVAAAPAPTEPAPGALKAKLSPRVQGGGEPGHSTKTAGGSQPQPATGQLQSETACTPAKPGRPGQHPMPDKLAPRATAKGFPQEAGDQGPQESLGPREDRAGTERKRKNRAPWPARSRDGGTVPERPPRAPRKQAAPSRVLPTKPRPSGQNSKAHPQPAALRKGDPAHAHRGARQGVLGQALTQTSPLYRPPKRSRAVQSAGLASVHACRTAESQSTLLSQLFGQRLTGFKIPLKKGTAD
ncbi:Zinc finger protein 469 [Galemys pyrenaicus]|uniref:Zinc finger protein 469 n=1 Tax=Galemys pyrenaicus TaxID=202257 RepID=A0A8J6DG02_GALPY|nr:Zinc finger protein 469 [Galemys pyrenaicus]